MQGQNPSTWKIESGRQTWLQRCPDWCISYFPDVVTTQPSQDNLRKQCFHLQLQRGGVCHGGKAWQQEQELKGSSFNIQAQAESRNCKCGVLLKAFEVGPRTYFLQQGCTSFKQTNKQKNPSAPTSGDHMFKYRRLQGIFSLKITHRVFF